MEKQLIFCLLIHLANAHNVNFSEKVATVRDQEARLMDQLFSKYQPEFVPRLNLSQPVKVQFAFELINIKEVNAKNQFISVYGWVTQASPPRIAGAKTTNSWGLRLKKTWINLVSLQKWFNPLLQWDATEYGGIDHITVDARKVWVPDILLYNNYDIQDRVGGGRETYKTQVNLSPNGQNTWSSPAIFKSLCDIEVTYFPFDVQTCALKFGSWSLSSAKLTLYKENLTTSSKNYLKNGEWELISKNVSVNVVSYPYNSYDDVTLTIKIGRNYFTYFVNLVIPCALISCMIFLSFLLPPECGERISLGITVLLAMTVFQQLTYQIFPSFDIPLLGQYYIATSVEISLALVATTMILNFKYRKNTKMSAWMRKFLLCRLARLVCLKETIEKSRPKPRPKLQWPNQRNNQPEDMQEDRLVQELKDMLHVPHQTSDFGAISYTNGGIAESSEQNGNCGKPTTTATFDQHKDNDAYEDTAQLSGILDKNGEELNEAELALRQWEWNMAASVLDRIMLWLSVIIGVVTFLGIFLRAPRVQNSIF